MARILLNVPKRFEAKTELAALSQKASADLIIFPEGFLRSKEESEMALAVSEKTKGTILTGFRDGMEEKVLVLESGRVTDTYTKCVLTSGEKEKGKRPGDRIRCVNTKLGKIAAPICYELHFPEVCRIMALEKPVLMVNPVGTGVYHKKQYEQWRSIARARAIENELPVAGCCHFCGEIPLAFAFNGQGEELLTVRSEHGSFLVDIDLAEGLKRPLGYFDDRMPELFGALAE